MAHGLVQAINCYKFVATIYLLSDVLPLLSNLSLVFQKENVNLIVVKLVVSGTIESLKALSDKPGVYL